jgi:hypothetical protein
MFWINEMVIQHVIDEQNKFSNLFADEKLTISTRGWLYSLYTSEKEMSLGSFLTAWGASLVGYGNSGGKVLWQCKKSVT